jgi:ATP-dependent DNA helicase RecQ
MMVNEREAEQAVLANDMEHLAPQPAPAPLFTVGSQVRVPKFDVGTVTSIEGDKITIAFPQHETRTFMAEFVEALEKQDETASRG